jgi:hypothetical protein
MNQCHGACVGVTSTVAVVSGSSVTLAAGNGSTDSSGGAVSDGGAA